MKKKKLSIDDYRDIILSTVIDNVQIKDYRIFNNTEFAIIFNNLLSAVSNKEIRLLYESLYLDDAK